MTPDTGYCRLGPPVNSSPNCRVVVETGSLRSAIPSLSQTAPDLQGFLLCRLLSCAATIINVGLLVFMRVWQPHPDSVLPLFVITTLLGLTDGIWNVNANGLCGSVFPDHYEEAFTGLRVAQGLGGAFSMAFAPFFCMAVKIYVMIGTAVLVLVGYIGAEVLMRRDSRQKNDLLFEKEVV